MAAMDQPVTSNSSIQIEIPSIELSWEKVRSSICRAEKCRSRKGGIYDYNSGNPTRAEIGGLLESAVMLSWNELLKSSPSSLVYVEYGIAPEPSLQYVKIWLATSRGYWNFVCEYWIASGFKSAPPIGLTFSNGFHSSILAEILDATMQAREGFIGSFSGDNRVSVIVVHSRTKDQLQKAQEYMSEAYERVGLVYTPFAERMAQNVVS